MKIIVMPLYRRPNYTKRVLKALSKCRGIEDYFLYMSLDGYHKEVFQTAHSFSACEYEVALPSSIGITNNVFECLENGFKKSDYVIYIEDDIILSEDALVYFEWAKQFQSDESIIGVGAYSYDGTPDDKMEDITLSTNLNPWGMALWKDRWELIKDHMYPNSDISWDTELNKWLDNKWSVVKPVVGRSQNIGAEGGTYVRDANWHFENQQAKHWAGDRQPYDGHYIKVVV